MNLLHTFLIQTDYFPHEDKTHIKTSNNLVFYIVSMKSTGGKRGPSTLEYN